MNPDISEPKRSDLTERQARELAYHKERAIQFQKLKDQPVSVEVATSPKRSWWNPYWHLYSLLRTRSWSGKKALVLGCGYGEDAIRLAVLGMEVSACDLSPEAVAIAKARVEKFSVGNQHLDIRQMAAEKLLYPDNNFDLVLAVDIFHHVDIHSTLQELRRVAAPHCTLVCLEMYTHSWLTALRESRLTTRYLYPALVRWIYGTDKPYITADERKLNERQVRLIADSLALREVYWFYAIINRLLPDRFENIEKGDRLALKLLGPIGSVLAGRVILTGEISK